MFRDIIKPATTPTVAAWTPLTTYKAGQLVSYRGALFTANAEITTGTSFTFANWTPVPSGNTLPPHTFDPRYTGLNQGAQSASRTNYARVHGAPLLISKLGINVGTASGNICLSVYSNTGTGSAARPDKRLATTGSVACPAAGEASIALDVPVVVVPGDWFALSADNATAQFFKALTAALTFTQSGYVHQTSAFPAPAVASSLAAASSLFYVVGVE